MSKNICEQCGGITGLLAQRVANTMSLHAGRPAFVCPGHLEPSPRDTQFAGFAKLLFDDVVPMFNNLSIELDNCEEQQAEKTKQGIIDCFAQCAYDLVQHVLSNEKLQWRPLEDISVSDIPDLTEWPEEQ